MSTTSIMLDASGMRSWNAIMESSAWFELPNRHWSTFSGDKAADALNGLVTNDVSRLPVGGGQYAAALTPKGKVVADLVVMRTAAESFLVGATTRAAAGWWDVVRKYVNPRLAKYHDESDQRCTFAIFGVESFKAVARIGGNPEADSSMEEAMATVVAEWNDWQHGTWNLGPTSVRLLKVPLLAGLPGSILIAAAADREVVRKRLVRLLGEEGDRAALDMVRIEAGRPLWGVDMDENTIAQEANLDVLDAISFEKGCYTGQETVARVHFRGHVNRRLVGLIGAKPLPSGATVVDETGKSVGDVRSSAISPRFGPVAIAMLRRELDAGHSVRVNADDGTIEAVVEALPFGSGREPG